MFRKLEKVRVHTGRSVTQTVSNEGSNTLAKALATLVYIGAPSSKIAAGWREQSGR